MRELSLRVLPGNYSVAKLGQEAEIPLTSDIVFYARTEEEISLVCLEQAVPSQVIAREDSWRILKIMGILDFSLVGILASIAGILADQGISIFAVSTYNTDYVLVKSEHLDDAVRALCDKGYEVIFSVSQEDS